MTNILTIDNSDKSKKFCIAVTAQIFVQNIEYILLVRNFLQEVVNNIETFHLYFIMKSEKKNMILGHNSNLLHKFALQRNLSLVSKIFDI